MCRAHLLSVPMQAPDKELQELSQRQLTALKQHAAAQVIKLQQAIESLNQSAIQHSLKPTHADIGSSAPPAYLNSNEEGILSSTDVGLPPALFIDNSFAHASFRPATPTTKERLQDTKQYIGAIALMLHDFQQQRDAAVSELQRRAEEKRRMVAQVQSQSALDLDQQVSKDVKRHLQNAQVSQYEQLMAIQETNRRHHNKVSSIRRMVEQQRSDSVADMIARDDKEQAREAARQAHLQAQAEERRRRNDAKEAKLAAKLAQFDRSRMQALESAPRVEGDFVKDLLQHGKQMIKDIACKKPVGKAHRSAPVPDDDPFSPGVLERLTKLPPRGIDLKKDLDTSMSNHVAQVARSKHYLVSEVHDRLERREKAHDKNFNELYKKKEDRWAAQKREEDEEQRRILSLKNAQKEQLDRLSQQREEQRRFAARRAASHTTTGLVDHWAARARLLIESACRAAMTPEPGDIGGQNRKMDPKSLKAGFEQTAHKR